MRASLTSPQAVAAGLEKGLLGWTVSLDESLTEATSLNSTNEGSPGSIHTLQRGSAENGNGESHKLLLCCGYVHSLSGDEQNATLSITHIYFHASTPYKSAYRLHCRVHHVGVFNIGDLDSPLMDA